MLAHPGGQRHLSCEAVLAWYSAPVRAGSILLALMAALAPVPARAQLVVEGDACGLTEQLPRTLARRGVRVVEGPVRVRIDAARIVVALGDGGVPRVVPRSPSCAADLDLVVLIIERWQREVGLDDDALALPPAPAAVTATRAPERASEAHVELGLRGGPEVGGRIRGDLELVGRAELARFVELLAGVRLVLPSSAVITAGTGERGTIEAWALGGWLGGGVGLVDGDARLFLAGTLGLERTVAGASDALFQRLDAGAWSPVAGVEGRYDRAVWDDRVWVSIGLAGRFRLDAPTFAVEGSGSTFEVPSATLVARLGLWVRFF